MSAHPLRGFLDLAGAHGLDVEEALQAAGCAHALDDLDRRLPWRQVERIADAVVERMGIAALLQATAHLRGEQFGPLFLVARYSATLRLALERLAKYCRVSTDLGEYRLLEMQSTARYEFFQQEFLSASFVGVNSAVWAVAMVAVVRQLTATDFRPKAVYLQTPRPSDPLELQVYSTCIPYPLRFAEPCSAIEFDLEVLDQPVVGADSVLELAMLSYISRLAARLPDQAGLGRRLAEILVDAIHRGEHGVHHVAGRLGITPRTLQRRLRDEGTSYKEVLERVRQGIAVEQIREHHVSVDEIASLLGFDRSSSFHRAFRRWTGVTPGEFRRLGADSRKWSAHPSIPPK